MQQLRGKAGLVETPWPLARAKSEQVWPEVLALHFLELLWCSLRLAFVYYHKLTQVVPNYRSHYNKTAKSCGFFSPARRCS